MNDNEIVSAYEEKKKCSYIKPGAFLMHPIMGFGDFLLERQAERDKLKYNQYRKEK